MECLVRPWGVMHVRGDGPAHAPAMLLINSLGTDLRMWDGIVAALPDYRILRFDTRGHGLSATPEINWSIEDLADDASSVFQHYGASHAILVGCSIGGLIAMNAALKNPTQVRGLVISNSAPKLGTTESWAARIEAVRDEGLSNIAAQILQRWFNPAFLTKPDAQVWRRMLLQCDNDGYAKTCLALGQADLTSQISNLKIPTTWIAGSDDNAVSADLVSASAALVADSEFHLLQDSGHIPAIDATAKLAKIIRDFAKRVYA